MTLEPCVRLQAEAHALQEFPRESCGLVVDTGLFRVYHPCRNIAASPSQHFTIHPADWAAAEDEGTVVGVVHSHPNGPVRPSEGDRASCEVTQLPWHLIGVSAGPGEAPVVSGVYSWEPDGFEAPLVGRAFHYGVLDCWALARDYYRRELGIDLPDFDHGPDGWWAVTDPEFTFSPYEDPRNLEAAGMIRLDGGELRDGDLIVMQVRSRSRKPNHVGVLIDAGRGTMLHHLYGALSERTIYGGYWREVTRFILRHQSNA